MSTHDHLKFLNHGEKSSTLTASASTLGGIDVPVLQGCDDVKSFDVNRSQHQKHVDVVDFLKNLYYDAKCGVEDICRNLHISLDREDKDVLDMMRDNPKIEINEVEGKMFFRYRAKYDIRNKLELFQLIVKTKSGVCMKDVIDSYGNIQEDVKEMIQSGDIIACKNKKAKDTILYPRGESFLTKLSGTGSVEPDRDFVATNEDLTNEIRRGDAILVGESWFRVSSWINSAKANQPNRAKAPLSVTSFHALSKDNEQRYTAEFTKTKVPLDSGYDGEEAFSGNLYRHGVTNDLRSKWMDTAIDFKNDKFRDLEVLEAELLRTKLITSKSMAAPTGKKRKPVVELGRRHRRRLTRHNAQRTNVHLKEEQIIDSNSK